MVTGGCHTTCGWSRSTSSFSFAVSSSFQHISSLTQKWWLSRKRDNFPPNRIIQNDHPPKYSLCFKTHILGKNRVGYLERHHRVGYLIRVPFKCVLPIVARHLFAGVLALICGCAKTCAGTGVQVTLVCRCACTGVQVTAHTADLWSWVQSFRGKLESQNFNSITLFEMSWWINFVKGRGQKLF